MTTFADAPAPVPTDHASAGVGSGMTGAAVGAVTGAAGSGTAGVAVGPAAAAAGATTSLAVPVLDVVVPVYNEEGALAACVGRLREHLHTTFPYPFRITVADNASTDRTFMVATHLAERHTEVRVVHLPEKGRGRALKAVWSTSDAPILAYMDVDLSTDLDALWPLVAPLMSGHSDVAIGSRLAHGARVVRGAKREAISRGYNLLLRAMVGARFRDAQCGFKAIRADVAAELLPLVEDTSWFFDTELLVLAERSGLRIHEVPVDWYDDPDSRVDIVTTAVADLRGVLRLRRGLARGTLPVAQIRRRIGRGAPVGHVGGQVLRFGTVGLLSTLVHLGLFGVLTGVLDAQLANVAGLLAATVINTWANRRWTFGVRGRRGAARHQLQGLALFLLFWSLTAGALALLNLVALDASAVVQTLVVAVANVVATVAKFLCFRRWIRPELQPVSPVR
ncbi:MAG TPA: bifunctional glycosyltransferase family 2/GtrA family protein [Dermatophilaceae bacterium]|nr:bifunctional glycosyltransferase family 2/GtrA family protein [Dermatophilaceae bacterium]